MSFEVDPATLAERKARIASMAESQWKLTEACESDVAKYLLLSTAGGAVATLSFMGAAPELRTLFWPCAALCSFFLGVLICGVMLIARALTVSNAYVQLLSDVDKYRKGDISWDELATRCSPTRGETVIKTLAAITYLCLVSGIVAGIFTVWTRPPNVPQPPQPSSTPTAAPHEAAKR